MAVDLDAWTWKDAGSVSGRYIVTELEGFIDPVVGGNRRKQLGGDTGGLSCMVIDTIYNRQVMATYRSEDERTIGVTRQVMFATARSRAAEHASRLNAECA